MQKYGIRSAILTILDMWRENLISKEKVKRKYRVAYKAELQNKKRNFKNRLSVNDDLESFDNNLQNPHTKPKTELIESFLTQKLTTEELKLVEERNEDYLELFFNYNCPGGGSFDKGSLLFQKDMKKISKSSDPDSTFINTYCRRRTFLIYVLNLAADFSSQRTV